MENLQNQLQTLFGSRDKHLTKINEAVDFLSRKTRKNLSILNVDSRENTVSLVSEDNELVECSYTVSPQGFRFTSFGVKNLTEVLSDDYVDNYTSQKVSQFVGNLKESNYDNATMDFDELLGAFTARSQINEYRSQVYKAQESLDKNLFEANNEKFSQLKEIKEKLKKEINEIVEFDIDVLNALKLNNAISKAFRIPKEEIKNLQELSVPNNQNSDLYQMICENELMRKEIINAKGSLSSAWHNNKKISELASCIYESESKIGATILEVVEDIPYFAIASKKEIQEVLASTYEVINPGTVSTKDIRKFTSQIFEAKKPIKEVVVEMLNLNYGININNLKMVPSFKTLAESQSTLFNLLSEHVEKGGICQKMLKEFSSHIKNKSGVAVLDISDFINELFKGVDFEDGEESNFLKPVDLSEAIRDLIKGEDDDTEEEKDDENEKVDTKKLRAVAKKAKEVAKKLKGGKSGEDVDEEEEGDDTEAEKDVDGDGDVDNVDKKVTDEKKLIKKGKKDKEGKKGKNFKDLKEQTEMPGVAPEAGMEAPEEEPLDAAPPEAGAISEEDMVGLVSDLETIFQDIDFSKGQEQSADEVEDEQAEVDQSNKDEELEKAQQDLEQAKSIVDELVNQEETGEVPPETEEVV